ncbi:DTW domain [Fragilaria crotonensis]|nr:DTW domain [Fragilaria crotonensis]
MRCLVVYLLVPFMLNGGRCGALVTVRHLTGSTNRLIGKRRVDSSLSASSSSVRHGSKFLDQVEASVARVLQKYGDDQSNVEILDLPPLERESLGVARVLNTRLQALTRNKDCRRCWLQQKHCVCNECKPLEGVGVESSLLSSQLVLPKVNRLFLLMHHKEIALHIDTAKLILAAFPETCRLVVGGLSGEYQESMLEMEDSIAGGNCLILFPSEDALTFDAVERGEGDKSRCWDLIVIDGTWAQARKLHARYVKDNATHVQLSEGAVKILQLAASDAKRQGHQLRRHPIKWREVSTLEATRLFLGDMMSNISIERPWDALALYQQIGDSAARRQLGPPRNV